MSKIKRAFCVLLALIVLVTAPGMLPTKVEADAAIADASLLSLALLFTTWAGITFQQSDNAVTAMQNFLQTKTTAASTLAGLVTKTVLDGAKLFISGDVRTAFRSVLPEIKDFFHVSDDNTGSLSGPIAVGNSVPVYQCAKYSDTPSSSVLRSQYFIYRLPVGSEWCLIADGVSLTAKVESDNYLRFYKPDSSYSFCAFDASQFAIFYASDENRTYFPYYNGSASRVYASWVPGAASLSPVSGSLSFSQSSTVNGSSALGSLNSADLDSENKYMNIEGVTSAVNSGLAGSTAAPGLTAEDYERILAEALAGTAVLPTTPEPTAEPTETTPEEDKTQIVTPDILDGMFSGLKGWLESLLSAILAAIQAIPEKIDSLWSSITGWWTETIVDFKSWIEVKIQSISVWWTSFWADTKAAILSIGASISEFFSVTFPAWVTDVREWASTMPRVVGEAIALALAAVFVPSAGFVDAKVASLVASFPFVNSVISSGKALGAAFTGFYSEPPIIWAELHNATTPYSWGDRAIILDLRWYAQYKPTVDTLISAFLWCIFVWKIFQKLPGIINGLPGDFVMDSLNNAGMVDHLPTRKEAYEVQRQNNRELFRRHKK